MLYRILPVALAFALAACGGSDDSNATASSGDPAPAAPGVEMPVDHVDLGPLDATMAAQGEEIYTTRCTTCHKMDERYIGPPLGDVVARREPEWILNMILAPDKMLQADAEAQALLAEYNVPMTNQNLTQDEARAVLEYLRQLQEGS